MACRHVLGSTPTCYLNMLDKPLGDHVNVTSLSHICSNYIGRCTPDLTGQVLLPCSRGRSTCYSDRLHDFSVIVPRCLRMFIYLNSFFPCTAKLWNFVCANCFLLTYDLNSRKSKVNGQLLS